MSDWKHMQDEKPTYNTSCFIVLKKTRNIMLAQFIKENQCFIPITKIKLTRNSQCWETENKKQISLEEIHCWMKIQYIPTRKKQRR